MIRILHSSLIITLFLFSFNVISLVAKNKWIFDGESGGIKYFWRPLICTDNTCMFQTLSEGRFVERRRTHELLCEEKLSRITFEENKLSTERRFKPVDVINRVLPSIWYNFQQRSSAKLPYKLMCNRN